MILGCSGMIVAAVAGGAGAAATGTMAGMEQSSSNPGWVNATNSIGQPLLMVSLALIIVGLWPRGRAAAAVALIGSVLLYVFLFVHYVLSLALVAGLILVGAYAIAYWPFWQRRSSYPV